MAFTVQCMCPERGLLRAGMDKESEEGADTIYRPGPLTFCARSVLGVKSWAHRKNRSERVLLRPMLEALTKQMRQRGRDRD
jgi:hypothetical protein